MLNVHNNLALTTQKQKQNVDITASLLMDSYLNWIKWCWMGFGAFDKNTHVQIVSHGWYFIIITMSIT